MKRVPLRQFTFFASLLLLASGTALRTNAQDDIYSHVRFVNKGEAAVEVTSWNPRGSRKPDSWKVEAGKSLDLTDEKGEKLRIGIISSIIKVGDAPQKTISEVSTRNDGFYEVVWNGKDFEPPTR